MVFFLCIPPLGDRKLRGWLPPPPLALRRTNGRGGPEEKKGGGQRAQPKWSGRRRGGKRKIAPSFLRGTRKEKRNPPPPPSLPFLFHFIPYESASEALPLPPLFRGLFVRGGKTRLRNFFLFRRLPRSSPRSTLSFVGAATFPSPARRKTTTDEDDKGEGEERALSLSLSALSTNNMWPGHILARGEDFPHIYASRR